MTFRRRTARLAAVAAAAAMLVAACGSDDEGTPTTGAGATTVAPGDTAGPGNTDPGTTVDTTPSDVVLGGSLKVATDGETNCGYIPSLCSVSYGPGAVRFAVLENLVRPAATPEGYEPVLAAEVTPNDDFTEFTVTLKPDILWSDGDSFTAQDVQDLFEKYVLVEGSFLRGQVGGLTGVEATDDVTLVFTLSAPQAPWPVLLTNVPIYKPVDGLTNTDLPIGTGPFVFDSFEPNVATHLVKNTNYWGKDAEGNQLPYLDEITVTAIASGDTRINALSAGDVDVAMSVDPIISDGLREEAANSYQVELNAGNGLFFNNSHAPTDDLRIRKALTHGLDKEEVLAAIGGLEPRDEYYVSSSPWYSEEASAVTPSFDADEAKALLAEYVNDPARSDGKAVGSPVTIDIAHVQGAVTAESVALVAQQQWEDIGFDVTVTPKDQSTLIGDAISGNFNVNYFGWATPHPYTLLTRNYGLWPATQSNYTHFNSDELIEIVAEMATTGVGPEMDALIAESNMILAEGVPLIFLHSTPLVWATGDNVGNVDLLPGNGFIDWSTLGAAA